MGMMTEQAQGRAIRAQAEASQAQTNERLDRLIAAVERNNALTEWVGKLLQHQAEMASAAR